MAFPEVKKQCWAVMPGMKKKSGLRRHLPVSKGTAIVWHA